MEVIHVVLGKANPDRMNGVNKMVHELATQLTDAGIATQVWGIANDTNHNYPARNYPTILFRKAKLPLALPKGFKEALDTSPTGSVFHLHGGFVPQMYRISRELRHRGIPYIFTPHGSYNVLAMKKNSTLKRVYAGILEKRLLLGAKLIHMVGQSEADGLQHWFSGGNTITIPYGYTAQAATKQSPQKDWPFIIGYCGRIDIFTKGLDLLLDGFQAFRKMHSDSKLWILGGGGEMPELHRLVEHAGLQSSVVFWGARYGSEKEQLLQKCHVFAHPSRNEGLPSAVLEAAGLGLPCVVTNATNVAGYIQQYHSGSVVEPTACGVYKGLSSVYEDWDGGKQKSLSDSAQRMVAEQFNWTTLVARYEAMYQQALES